MTLVLDFTSSCTLASYYFQSPLAVRMVTEKSTDCS